MLFTRSSRYRSPLSIEAIKQKLLGQHMKIHNLDFEVTEKDGNTLRIIPHAEQIESIKTLPITHVDFSGEGNQTKLRISSKMRRIDKGGPILITAFCAVLLGIGIFFQVQSSEETSAYVPYFLGLGLLIFIIFWWRMESGYFDYVRKIRNYIKKESGV